MSLMKIFVSNLLFDAVEGDVQKVFEKFGRVSAVTIMRENKGGRSRGFGFVEMPDEPQAQAAIAALNGQDFMGRSLIVNPARLFSARQWEQQQKR